MVRLTADGALFSRTSSIAVICFAMVFVLSLVNAQVSEVTNETSTVNSTEETGMTTSQGDTATPESDTTPINDSSSKSESSSTELPSTSQKPEPTATSTIQSVVTGNPLKRFTNSTSRTRDISTEPKPAIDPSKWWYFFVAAMGVVALMIIVVFCYVCCRRLGEKDEREGPKNRKRCGGGRGRRFFGHGTSFRVFRKRNISESGNSSSSGVSLQRNHRRLNWKKASKIEDNDDEGRMCELPQRPKKGPPAPNKQSATTKSAVGEPEISHKGPSTKRKTVRDPVAAPSKERRKEQGE